MCGICGAVWTSEAKAVSIETLDAMTDSLAHRGPDDRGTLMLPMDGNPVEKRGVALGHRRLSIIDLSPLGRQPMGNEDGAVQVTFNGEIYNFSELRDELRARGHRFRTATDTETIVHLYEEYGEAFPARLSGMFALGLWDARNKRLVLVRDRMGKKPLFYKMESDRLLFASELKSILRVPGIRRQLDPLALDGYLTWQYVPFPRTIYRDINKLEPATYAVWEPGKRLRIESYWQPDCTEDKTKSPTEWRDALRAALEHAVEVRLQSDVPLGAFLSGGIDSSIIVGLMQKLSPGRVKTFSIGFHQREYDETTFAKHTAARLGTEHHEFFVTPDAESILPELVRQYDEPFADSSAIPTWYLSQMTRTGVTVALSGDGGDELFAGYDRYKAVKLGRILDMIPGFGRRFLAGPLRRCIPASVRQRSFTRRLKRFLEALDMSPMERYMQWIAIFNRSRKNSLYNGDALKSLLESDAADRNDSCQNDTDGCSADTLFKRVCGYDALDFLLRYHERVAFRDPVTAISMTDLATYLPGDLMTKVDIASMRHSLEVRAPFLDTKVVELAAAMPASLKLRGKTGKAILRETFKEFLPDELLNRPKTGFGVPLDYWFRGKLNPLLRDLLLSPSSDRFGVFDKAYIREMIEQHEKKQFDHAARLWSLLVFELWSRNEVGAE